MIQAAIYHLLESKSFKQDSLLVLSDYEQASRAYAVCSLFEIKAFLLPELRISYGDDLSSFRDEMLSAMQVLREFYTCKSRKLLISPLHSILYPLPKPEILSGLDILLNTECEYESFKSSIIDFGYECVEVVELEGEVSFRGEIIDIFIPNTKLPYRILFNENSIESIRNFELQSQMSKAEEIESLSIYPALFNLSKNEMQNLKNSIEKSEFDSFDKDIASLGFWFLDKAWHISNELEAFISPEALEVANEIYSIESSLPKRLDSQTLQNFKKIEQVSGYSDIINANAKTLLELHKNKQAFIITRNEIMLKEHNFTSAFNFIESSAIVNILTPQKLIISLNSEIKKAKQKKSTLKLNELEQGEYVVHRDYGVGVFSAMIQATIAGCEREFLQIDYLGEDRLLLPVENLNMIDKYIADSGIVPMLDRLGKGSFAKIKQKVRQKLLQIASSIIELAAKRNLSKGIKINTNDEKLLIFRKTCGFNLTEDQIQSVKEIFSDFSSGKVMDRLLSGDVGFGKTEVAMNAIFAAFLSGYQSLMIVPTTLLCAQHFASLKARFKDYGLKIARCDRFLSAKEKKDLLDSLKNGSVDVVIGTHALLNAECKNLALVVIDEEHKFGVKQKEAIKAITKKAHLLSMSATPIPRTLNMALSQIKSLSTLRTPPKNRLPVRTFLKIAKDSIIKEAILREIRRGGQIFFIHNNIASIERQKKALLELLPNLKIAVLHSQINQLDSEDIMLNFAANAYNVLLCTSIVESGIHLPNANTIIVSNADRFGIADLHQLRGRVGRGDKEGFCYFLVESLENITPEAKKRLNALEKNSYLGSGENLAYHDLEIRGGGNLLGQAQSGHIKNIGYSLYLHMLEECINELSGKASVESSADIKLQINAFLSPNLIVSDKLRLELYRRLSLCENVSEVTHIEAEIYDRFGKLDSQSSNFLDLIRIKILANKLHLKQILHYAQTITLIDKNDEKIKLNSPSKDSDDCLQTILEYLHKEVAKIGANQ